MHYVWRCWNSQCNFPFLFHLPELGLVSLIPRRICRAKARDHASEWNEVCFSNDAGLPIEIKEKDIRIEIKWFSRAWWKKNSKDWLHNVDKKITFVLIKVSFWGLFPNKQFWDCWGYVETKCLKITPKKFGNFQTCSSICVYCLDTRIKLLYLVSRYFFRRVSQIFFSRYLFRRLSWKYLHLDTFS